MSLTIDDSEVKCSHWWLLVNREWRCRDCGAKGETCPVCKDFGILEFLRCQHCHGDTVSEVSTALPTKEERDMIEKPESIEDVTAILRAKRDQRLHEFSSMVSRQLGLLVERINDGIREGMSAAGIIENKFGLLPGEYDQDLRRELMVITNAFAEATERREDWKKSRDEQKEWLRKKCCQKCVSVIEKGF